MLFDLTTVQTDGGVVVRASGEVDLHVAPRLRSALEHAFDRRPASIVLDLADVSFMDSSGLSAIVFLRRRGAELDISVGVVRPVPEVFRVFELTGLDGLVPFVSAPRLGDDVDD